MQDVTPNRKYDRAERADCAGLGCDAFSQTPPYRFLTRTNCCLCWTPIAGLSERFSCFLVLGGSLAPLSIGCSRSCCWLAWAATRVAVNVVVPLVRRLIQRRYSGVLAGLFWVDGIPRCRRYKMGIPLSQAAYGSSMCKCAGDVEEVAGSVFNLINTNEARLLLLS